MNSNHITYEPVSCNRQAGRGHALFLEVLIVNEL